MPAEPKRYVSFEIGAVFPVELAVARFITRLAVVTNDLMLTQENTALEYAKPGGGREGVPLYYLFTAGSHFREAMKLLAYDLLDPDVEVFTSGLDSDSRSRLARLRGSFEPWKGSFVETKLKPLRDQTFHYPDDIVVIEALKQSARLMSGIDLGSGSYLETRYEFADEIMGRLARSAIGETDEEATSTLEQFAALMLDYVYFAHAAIAAYLRSIPRDTFDVAAQRPPR